MRISAEALVYLAYLVALLPWPLLVLWRWGRGLPWGWGLALALEVIAAELLLVLFIAWEVELHLPREIKRRDVGGIAILHIGLPGMAVLTGGGLAIAWLTIVSIRRAIARRRA